MERSLPFPLPYGFWALVEDAVERLLERDAGSANDLAAIAGKVVKIELDPWGLSVYICATQSGLNFYESMVDEPDTVISASPSAFVRMMLSASPQQALFSGGVRISGNADVAKRLQAVLSGLKIDNEAHVASLIGRSLSERLFGALRSGNAWARDTITTLQIDAGEYLQEESRDLPSSGEVEVYCEQVDRLRADTDRLEARIRRLQALQAGELNGLSATV